jgi:hypothetical protein
MKKNKVMISVFSSLLLVSSMLTSQNSLAGVAVGTGAGLPMVITGAVITGLGGTLLYRGSTAGFNHIPEIFAGLPLFITGGVVLSAPSATIEAPILSEQMAEQLGITQEEFESYSDDYANLNLLIEDMNVSASAANTSDEAFQVALDEFNAEKNRFSELTLSALKKILEHSDQSS